MKIKMIYVVLGALLLCGCEKTEDKTANDKEMIATEMSTSKEDGSNKTKKEEKEDILEKTTEVTTEATTEATTEVTTEVVIETTAVAEVVSKEMTEQQAYDAVVNYCYEQMPMLYDMSSDEYCFYWYVRETTDTEYVIDFRSYTAAHLYYYVNKQTGDTRETEYVPGIVDVETPTGVTYNAWDYIN